MLQGATWVAGRVLEPDGAVVCLNSRQLMRLLFGLRRLEARSSMDGATGMLECLRDI